MNKKFSIFLIFMFLCQFSWAQEGWKMNSRLSFYTSESLAEILLVIPEEMSGKKAILTLSGNGKLLALMDTVLPQRIIQIPFNIEKLNPGIAELALWVSGQDLNVELQTQLHILSGKSNQVKIDRLTGGLIAGSRPFYPFGFYCYSPVQPTLAEEEVVKGFNMMSPYQQITENTLKDREAYMDRCARLGMKVHYNLLSVAGGGGVGSGAAKNQSGAQKRQRLIDEVNHFKDHPALLGWYISDEPTGHGANPDSLKADYDLIKSLDPYHPISIVFMAPARAREYAEAMDIVMADPYPIPNQPVRSVATVTQNLSKEFFGEKPVWIVPQAFGGSEHWSREPSQRELRAMTWLSIVEGATGIQYFVRNGLNGFPKSTATWGQAGQISLEIQQIAPFLLSGIDNDSFSCQQEGIRLLVKEFKGELLIIAVNESSEPKKIQIESNFRIEGTEISVLFEDRNVKAQANSFGDMIDGFDRRVYLLTGFQPLPEYHAYNLILDPGFENRTSTGFPASCYARVGADKGATYFLDAIEPYSGTSSLRLVTPANNRGVTLSFFPVRLNSGSGYTLSVWARLDTTSVIIPERTFFQKLFGLNKYEGASFKVSCGTYADEKYRLSGEWENYKLRFRVPENGTETISINPLLELVSQGTAWFDHLEIYPDPLINFGINPAAESFEVSVISDDSNTVLRYTLDGRIPELTDPEISGPLNLNQSAIFTAGVFLNDVLVNYSVKPFNLHKAVGKKPLYKNSYSTKYNAGGDFGLVDGIKGSRDYMDGRWQGFMKKDLDVLIDLKSPQSVRKISVGCLQDTRSWIFMPTDIEFWGSVDGKKFFTLGSMKNTIDQRATGAIRKDYTLNISPLEIQAVRIKVTNLGLCPDWHNGKGNAAFLFVDEIIVE